MYIYVYINPYINYTHLIQISTYRKYRYIYIYKYENRKKYTTKHIRCIETLTGTFDTLSKYTATSYDGAERSSLLGIVRRAKSAP